MPCPDCRGTDAGVVFCPYHSKMEQRLLTLEAILSNRVEEENERRRYALLQAAAVNLPKLVAISVHVGTVDAEGEVYNYELNQTVSVAEDLLAKIEEEEKREIANRMKQHQDLQGPQPFLAPAVHDDAKPASRGAS